MTLLLLRKGTLRSRTELENPERTFIPKTPPNKTYFKSFPGSNNGNRKVKDNSYEFKTILFQKGEKCQRIGEERQQRRCQGKSDR